MILLDANVVVASSRPSHPSSLGGAAMVRSPDREWRSRARARARLGGLRATGHQPAGVCRAPTLGEAFAFVDAVRSAPGYRRHVDGLAERFDEFRAMCLESDAAANLVPDAYVAAIARSWACPIATFDRGFRRFDDVRLIIPDAE